MRECRVFWLNSEPYLSAHSSSKLACVRLRAGEREGEKEKKGIKSKVGWA